MPLNDKDHEFASEILSASLNFVAMLFAVITFIAADYKANFSDTRTADIYKAALQAVGLITVASGLLALSALIHLRFDWFSSVRAITFAFGAIILASSLGVPYIIFTLMP